MIGQATLVRTDRETEKQRKSKCQKDRTTESLKEIVILVKVTQVRFIKLVQVSFIKLRLGQYYIIHQLGITALPVISMINSVFLCLCLCRYLYLSLSFSFFLSLSLSLFISLYLFLSVSVSLTLFIFLTLFLFLPLPLEILNFGSLYLCLSRNACSSKIGDIMLAAADPSLATTHLLYRLPYWSFQICLSNLGQDQSLPD